MTGGEGGMNHVAVGKLNPGREIDRAGKSNLRSPVKALVQTCKSHAF